jgi:hemoglobin/transferrin/lactoferrin receptor protein
MLPLLLLAAVPQGIQLEETVVTAPRAAQVVTSSATRRQVVEGDELRETGERSLPAALRKTAGVWIQETNLGGGAPVVRGLYGGRVLLVVDGFRINDSTTRLGPNQSLSAIDPAIVDHVEVIRGPSSVLYGSDAIGGVIAVWTRRRQPESRDDTDRIRMWDAEHRGTYDTSIGSPRVSLGGDAAWKEHSVFSMATGFDYDGYKAGDNEDVPNIDYNGQSLFGAYEYAMGEGRTLRVTGRASRDFNVPRTDRMNPGFGQTQAANLVWKYSLQDRRGYALAYTDERSGDFSDRMQVRLNMHTYEEHRDITNQAGTTSTFSDDFTRTFGIGADWQAALGENHLLTWGVDLSHDDVDSFKDSTTASVTTPVAGNFAPNAEYLRAGMFLQDEVFAFDPWFLTAGLRFSAFDYSFDSFDTNESWSDSVTALTASLEAARELARGVELTTSISEGFRAPNLDDLANDGTFAGGTELSNPDLDPERSLHFDVGVSMERVSWGINIGTFATRINEALGRRLIDVGNPGITGDETYRRDNTGRMEFVGAEIGFHRRLGEEGSPYSLVGNLNYVRGRHKDPIYGNTAARRTPPLHGMLEVTYQPEESHWFYIPNGRFGLAWADKQDRLHPEDVADPRIHPDGTAGWLTWNAEIWGEMGLSSHWRVSLLNMTDKHYRVHGSGIPAPGQRAVFGIHVRF